MTGTTVAVTAEWALRGKTPDDWGPRILACSDGDLRRRNFEEALDRFSPGTLDDLPQVSVSYLARADQVGGSYLTLAIRELAQGQRDANNREIISTRYFCVPYEQLAADAITYEAMYEAFRALPLPSGDGPAMTVELAVTPAQVPAVGDLAYQAAALLLTGRPVCVLGAGLTSLLDRLRFMDTVMSLLPYGMRSRMSASTWTSSTYQTHRFRLFFSNAPRSAESQGQSQDHAVVWGQPDRTQLSAVHGPAYDYLDWLQDRVQGPVLRLAEMTGETGFGARQVLQMLEQVGAAGLQPDQDQRDPETGHFNLPHQASTPSGGTEGYADAILLECGRQITAQNLDGLEAAITQLRTYADTSSRIQDRKRYQDLIWKHQLLRPGLPIGRLERPFYEALLVLAFGMPLSYEGYCQLESCLGISPAEAPHRSLLKAIERGAPTDDRVIAIVLRHLGERKLRYWFQSGQVGVVQLITWLADEWDRPDHARIVCDVTLRYLRDRPGNYDRQAVLSALHDHGYLAQALDKRHAGAPQYQVYAAYHFLRAAYGGSLDRSAAEDVLAGTHHPPTPALLGAVLLQLTNPAADAAPAEKAYLAGQLKFTEFDAETRARLERFIPGANAVPYGPASQAPPAPGTPRPASEPPERLRFTTEPSPGPHRPLAAKRQLFLRPPPIQRSGQFPPDGSQ
jgi:hypothetical protein